MPSGAATSGRVGCAAYVRGDLFGLAIGTASSLPAARRRLPGPGRRLQFLAGVRTRHSPPAAAANT